MGKATEVNNDSLATAQLMGEATRRIRVGTWVASIHMRHSYACAKAASLIADATGGRMILGLGVSHQPVNAALGADMPSPTTTLRRYTTEVAGWLRGDGPTTHLPQIEAPDRAPLDVAVGLPTFVGDDIEEMRNAARANLALFTTFPFYQRMFRASGFAEEATKAEQGAGGDSLSNRLLDAVCLIGPISRCREQLAAFRAAGVDLPILSPPVGVDGSYELIRAFRR